MLIVFAGLPGVGKTTLARGLAAQLRAVHLRIDSIEQALASCSLQISPAEDAGYCVGYAVAEENLRLGLTVVADSVNPVELTRSAWHDTARRAEAPVKDVEVVCSDPIEHRRRVEERSADGTGLRLPSWQDVLDRHYDPWAGDRFVLDTAGRSPEVCLRDLLEHLGGDRIQA